MSRLRRQARLIRRAEEEFRDRMWRADFNDDEDAYGFKPRRSPAFLAECDRQWRDIPDDPAEIAVWMKGEPINPEESSNV